MTVATHDLILLQNVRRQAGQTLLYQNESQFEEIRALHTRSRDMLIQYYSRDFGKLQRSSQQSQSFRAALQEISTGKCCQLGWLGAEDRRLCETNYDGIINRGMQNFMEYLLKRIQVRDENNALSENPALLTQYYHSYDYTNETLAQVIVFKLLDRIIDLFQEDGIRYLGQTQSLSQLFFICACSLYLAVFIVIIVHSAKRFFREFNQVKRAVQFIPFQRIDSDLTTIYLLKKNLDA